MRWGTIRQPRLDDAVHDSFDLFLGNRNLGTTALVVNANLLFGETHALDYIHLGIVTRESRTFPTRLPVQRNIAILPRLLNAQDRLGQQA